MSDLENPLFAWRTSAINLPEHADNPVHTDEGATAAGFPSALVAGTTVHAYLTHPPAAAWGAAWLDGGWSELRLLSPVFDNDVVDLVPTNGDTIEARVDGEVRATLAVALTAPASRAGRTVIQQHPAMSIELDESLGTYGVRAGDDLDVYRTEGRAHPAVWPSIGNTVTKMFHVTGPWVHVRSAVTHLERAAVDAIVVVTSALVDRFDTRAGERVVIDIEATVDGVPVAIIEHESIIKLA